MSAVRPVSTSQQTGDGDVKPHQPSNEASQRGTEAQCHVGNDASEHTAETGFSPVLLASVVHGEVELCVLTSSLRRQVELLVCDVIGRYDFCGVLSTVACPINGHGH